MTWQPAAVLYPDIEMVLCQGFGQLLRAAGESDVIVDRRVPNPRPRRLVAFIRDGGQPSGLRDRPRVRCRIFDESEQGATDLARLVAGLSARMVGTASAGQISYASVLSGPLDVAEPSKQPQRYLLLEFHTRPTPIS